MNAKADFGRREFYEPDWASARVASADASPCMYHRTNECDNYSVKLRDSNGNIIREDIMPLYIAEGSAFHEGVMLDLTFSHGVCEDHFNYFPYMD